MISVDRYLKNDFKADAVINLYIYILTLTKKHFNLLQYIIVKPKLIVNNLVKEVEYTLVNSVLFWIVLVCLKTSAHQCHPELV